MPELPAHPAAPDPGTEAPAAPHPEHARGLGAIKFLTEPVPERGVPLPVVPGVWRVVAGNPGPMTYHGTNTYLIESEDGMSVLDPGPDDPAHVAAVLAAAGGNVRRILLSHGHHDHADAVSALRAASGAPVFGFRPSIRPDLEIDHPLAEGDEVAGLTVLHTPGHAADHLCFATANRCLFTGDHVMTWSTSIVAPPNGDMAAYFVSLRRLLDRDDHWLLPGHGPMRGRPAPFFRALFAHRVQREKAILAALGKAPLTVSALADIVYRGIGERLRAPAERNLLGHLLKLEAEGRARRDGTLWRAARPPPPGITEPLLT